MPCFCDIPDEEDQIEFERKCKIRMFFEIKQLLTPEQINRASELNIPFLLPLPDPNTALCKLCSILDKEQMEQISAFFPEIEWKHKTLHDWYVQHCRDDKEAILM